MTLNEDTILTPNRLLDQIVERIGREDPFARIAAVVEEFGRGCSNAGLRWEHPIECRPCTTAAMRRIQGIVREYL